MVCSNSLGSEEVTSASGLLKRELKMLDSFFLRHADKARVPAGSSLSVDRLRLAADITARAGRPARDRASSGGRSAKSRPGTGR